MVEIIPKPIEKTPLWINVILLISIIVSVAAVGTYLFLGYSVNKSQKILEEKERELAQPLSPEEKALEGEILKYRQKLDDFSFFIEKHQMASGFFAFLEKTTHPQVLFSRLKLDIQEAEVQLSGESEKTALGQQLLIFRQNEKKIKTELTALRPEEGEDVNFTVSLSLSPEIFKFSK